MNKVAAIAMIVVVVLVVAYGMTGMLMELNAR